MKNFITPPNHVRFLAYVNRTLGTSKPVTEIPFKTCSHCEYIFKGFHIL